jgi:hypothetical protein
MIYLKTSLAFLAPFVMLWMMAGFVAWDWDPANWEPVSRLAFVWLASALGVFAVTAALGAM